MRENGGRPSFEVFLKAILLLVFFTALSMRVAKKWKNIHKKKLKQPSPDRKGEPGKVVVVEVVLAAVAFALLFFFPSSFAVWPRHNRIQFFSFYGKRGGKGEVEI